MTRRYYQVEMQYENSALSEVNRSYVFSADLSGPPREIHAYSGLHELVTTLDCKAGRRDDFAAVVSEAYKPLRVVSCEEFTFGIVGISRGDVLRHLIELGALGDPFNQSTEEILNKERINGLEEVLSEDALEMLNEKLELYRDAIYGQVRQEGLKIQTYTLDQPFTEHGRPTHPVYPNSFLPGFLQNTFNPDLSKEQSFLTDVVERCANASYQQVFAELALDDLPPDVMPSRYNDWLH